MLRELHKNGYQETVPHMVEAAVRETYSSAKSGNFIFFYFLVNLLHLSWRLTNLNIILHQWPMVANASDYN